MERQVEGYCVIKHIFHIRHVGHVPFVERLVEAPSLPIVSPKYFPVRGRVGGVVGVEETWAVASWVVGATVGQLFRGAAAATVAPSSVLAAPSSLSSRIRPEGELEARNGSNFFSRPVKPVSKHANLSKDSHWLCATTPDHHCKQTARSTIIFEELRTAETRATIHAASSALPILRDTISAAGLLLQPPHSWKPVHESSRASHRTSPTRLLHT